MEEVFNRDSLSRTNLSEQVAGYLTNAIMNDSYGAGAPLPAERELALQFGVSTHVVREALKRMQALGLVEIRHGAGTFVNPLKRWNIATSLLSLVRNQPTSVLDVHDVRAPLEMMAAELAARVATKDDIQELDRCLNVMRASLRDLKELAAADLEFHLCLARATHNQMLWVVLQPLIAPIHECMLRSVHAPFSVPHTLAQHEELTGAVRAHSVKRSRDAMRRHLETSRQELTSVLRSDAEDG